MLQNNGCLLVGFSSQSLRFQMFLPLMNFAVKTCCVDAFVRKSVSDKIQQIQI